MLLPALCIVGRASRPVQDVPLGGLEAHPTADAEFMWQT